MVVISFIFTWIPELGEEIYSFKGGNFSFLYFQVWLNKKDSFVSNLLPKTLFFPCRTFFLFPKNFFFLLLLSFSASGGNSSSRAFFLRPPAVTAVRASKCRSAARASWPGKLNKERVPPKIPAAIFSSPLCRQRANARAKTREGKVKPIKAFGLVINNNTILRREPSHGKRENVGK